MKIRPDQMDGDLLEKVGLNPYEVWSANPRSNLAKKARRALLAIPEGKAHVERLERLMREDESEEWETYRNLCKWAERLGKTPPTEDEIRDYDGSHMCKVRFIEETFAKAVRGSALESFVNLPLPEKTLSVFGEKLYFGGLIGVWDGFDISWRLDEDEIGRLAAMKAVEDAKKLERGAPHIKHDFDNPRHHGWS